MTAMRTVLITGVLSVGLAMSSAEGAAAASITNSGSSSLTLIVVEDGNRMDLFLDAGSTEPLCPAGCFVTLPNGDRLGLQGGESVDIRDGIITVN